VTYYQDDLALVHHLGFGFHADACAPGILARLSEIRDRQGLVLEVGCGSGLLTRHLVAAGHRVIASDASPAMLALAREHARGAEEFRRIRLPDDPLPAADAVVSTGHALNYLPDKAAIDAALVAIAESLRPAGVVALDLCDLEYGRVRLGRSSPSTRRRLPAASSGTCRPSCATPTVRGAATTRSTTTS
jgi:SAM-dependent methyltransferase